MRRARVVLSLLALASCAPAASPKAAGGRQASVVRTSCPERAPSFEDSPDQAASLTDRTIERICVLGATNDATRAGIARAIPLHEGDKLAPGSARHTLDAIVALGTTEDAAIGAEARGEGVMVLIEVRERPRVGEVVQDPSGVVVPLAQDTPLDRTKLRGLTIAAQEKLVSEGYGAAKTDAEVEPLGPGTVRVRMLVNKGPRWTIAKTSFPGAKRVSVADLEKTTGLERSAYDPEQVSRASLKLSALYYDRGMIAAKVSEPNRDIATDGAVTLAWAIDEGDVYKVSAVHFGRLGESRQKELASAIQTRPQAVFNRGLLVTDLERIKAIFEKGGKKVELTPETSVDPKKKTVDIVISITETN